MRLLKNIFLQTASITLGACGAELMMNGGFMVGFGLLYGGAMFSGYFYQVQAEEIGIEEIERKGKCQ